MKSLIVAIALLATSLNTSAQEMSVLMGKNGTVVVNHFISNEFGLSIGLNSNPFSSSPSYYSQNEYEFGEDYNAGIPAYIIAGQFVNAEHMSLNAMYKVHSSNLVDLFFRGGVYVENAPQYNDDGFLWKEKIKTKATLGAGATVWIGDFGVTGMIDMYTGPVLGFSIRF